MSIDSAGTSRVSGRLGEHRLDVEAVAARTDQQEERVQPGGADHGPVPVAEQHPAVGRRAAGCRRGCRCARGVAAGHLGEPGGQRGRLVEVLGEPGRSGSPDVVPVPGRGQVGELLGERCPASSPAGGGVSTPRDLLEHRQRTRPGRPAATAGAARAPRRTRSRAPPSPRRRGPEQRGRGSGRRAAAPACAPPRGRTRRTSAGPCTDAAFTKCREPSSQVSTRGEAGGEARRPGTRRRRPVTPHAARSAPRICGGRWAHSRRRAVRPCGIG